MDGWLLRYPDISISSRHAAFWVMPWHSVISSRGNGAIYPWRLFVSRQYFNLVVEISWIETFCN
eukprot:scaffold20934_cov52-Attheya_sp.AAC.2